MMKNYFNSQRFSSITVEPSYALFYFIEHCCSFFHENLLLQKACRNNATHEPDLTTACDDEPRGIAFVAYTHSILNLPNTPLMILVATFMIKWSDRAGKLRKPIILLPLIGIMVEVICASLHSYFWTWPIIAVVLTRNFAKTMSGGIILFHSSASLFVTDNSDEKSRMTRIGMLSLIPHFGIPLSSLVSGYLLRTFGFIYCYLMCLVLSIISFVLGVILIKDTPVPVTEPVKICNIMNPLQILGTVKVLFKKRAGRKRMILLLLIFAKMVVNFSITGEHAVFYLYTRHRFHWNEVQYSMFTAYRHVGLIFGTTISLFVATKVFKLHDALIGCIACGWNAIGALCYFLAHKNWHFYVVPWIEMFHSVSKVSGKSLMTKVVDHNELGDLFSSMMILNTMVPLNKLFYSLLFKEHMDTLPNIFFLISIVLGLIGMVTYYFSYRYSKSGYSRMK
ncbi:lysosomal proton-coupled steroid conjugate and bile acid symporter SLC46A3-like [Planococcus citri]|uniref:lysosomal proton-coupled steroid conjugate and bile acid symporter SLC46A3-like n=1 Tax=Planococcus citri TaxID=170843 RepID=UPI0031FA219C